MITNTLDKVKAEQLFKKKQKTELLHIRLTAETKKKLKHKAEIYGITMNEVVQKVLDEFL